MLLPGGAGLVDPCEKESVDTADNLTLQQREDITSTAQVDLPVRHLYELIYMVTLPSKILCVLR